MTTHDKATVRLIALAMVTLALPGVTNAQDLTVQMNEVNDTGIGDSIGVVVITEATHGLEFTPALIGLSPGAHGFHVHEHGSCESAMNDKGKQTAAMAAGGHYDPEDTHQHGSPLNDEGHKGDLPALVVDDSGHANTMVAAARLSMDDLVGRTLMIHVGGDNYSDSPKPSGGGGARFACGRINP